MLKKRNPSRLIPFRLKKKNRDKPAPIEEEAVTETEGSEASDEVGPLVDLVPLVPEDEILAQYEKEAEERKEREAERLAEEQRADQVQIDLWKEANDREQANAVTTVAMAAQTESSRISRLFRVAAATLLQAHVRRHLALSEAARRRLAHLTPSRLEDNT